MTTAYHVSVWTHVGAAQLDVGNGGVLAGSHVADVKSNRERHRTVRRQFQARWQSSRRTLPRLPEQIRTLERGGGRTQPKRKSRIPRVVKMQAVPVGSREDLIFRSEEHTSE